MRKFLRASSNRIAKETLTSASMSGTKLMSINKNRCQLHFIHSKVSKQMIDILETTMMKMTINMIKKCKSKTSKYSSLVTLKMELSIMIRWRTLSIWMSLMTNLSSSSPS